MQTKAMEYTPLNIQGPESIQRSRVSVGIFKNENGNLIGMENIWNPTRVQCFWC